MTGDPPISRAERHPGGETYAECRAEADRLSAAPDGWPGAWIARDWFCAPAGETPECLHATD